MTQGVWSPSLETCTGAKSDSDTEAVKGRIPAGKRRDPAQQHYAPLAVTAESGVDGLELAAGVPGAGKPLSASQRFDPPM